MNVRKTLLKTWQTRGQPLAQKRGDRTQAQGAADHPGVQALQFGINAAISLPHHGRQALPLGAEFNASRTPMKQSKAQALLQLANLLAHRSGRDVQFFGAAGERQMPCGAGKHMQPDIGLAVEGASHSV